MNDVEERLDELRDRGLYRRMRVVSGPQGPRVLLDGRPVLLLCSNNYLGLADHPRVREAAAEAAMRYGAGAGASRLVSGNMTIHRRLEEQLADFKGSESCLLFGSGYLANVGVVSALAREGDVVFSDALNHASIIDGCRLARAETFVYDHLDADHLEWGLRQAGGRGALIVTDGVFSMDGDVAPLEKIVELAQRYDARVLVDEAHGTGAVGPAGRGAVAAAGLEDEVDVIVGTLGKSLGSYGAYVCCERPLAKYLDQHGADADLLHRAAPARGGGGDGGARPAARAAAPRREASAQRRTCCARRSRAHGLPSGDSDTQIVPLIVGDAAATVTRQRACARAGRVRPGDPAAHSARRHLATTARRDGLAHAVRAARGRRRARGGGPPGARATARDGASAPPRVFDALRDAA